MIIGIDVDGIIADFNTGFKKLFVEIIGEDKFGEGWTPEDINTWYYTTEQYGYTKEQDRSVWKKIKESESFWYDLPPYVDTYNFLQSLSGDFIEDVYFITNRMGKHVKVQTEEWLFTNGFRDVPTVLISADKAGICKGLNITHYIDDKNENCQSVSVGNTKTYMIVRNWNKPLDNVRRIPKLEHFLEALKQDREAN